MEPPSEKPVIVDSLAKRKGAAHARKAGYRQSPAAGVLLILILVALGAVIARFLPDGKRQFENLAYDYIEQPQTLSIGITILGAIFAGLVARVSFTIQRVAYFVYFWGLSLIVVAVSSLWIAAPSAMMSGSLWILASASATSFLVYGYLTAITAMARSRDICGHAGYAALAFVPLANFWLMFAGSNRNRSPSDGPQVTVPNGPVGIALGFTVIIFSYAMSSGVVAQITQAASVAQTDPAFQEKMLQRLIDGQGLEATLLQIAGEVSTPDKVDDITTLRRVEVSGSILRYSYEVSSDINGFSGAFRDKIIRDGCNSPLRPVLRAGATIEHRYDGRRGNWIATVTISEPRCS